MNDGERPTRAAADGPDSAMCTAVLLAATALSAATAIYGSGSTDLPPPTSSQLNEDELELDSDELPSVNDTALLGEYLGGPCTEALTCKETLAHVACNKKTQLCECEPGYPVRLGQSYGCAKPVNLGEQCFYYQACMYTDQNADCVQVKHNAICQCKEGYHLATVQKPMKRVFCSQDLVVIATDLSTLLGVAGGLGILTALICFTLKLFSGSRPRHYANTNLAPPIIFAQSGKPSYSYSKNWPSLSSIYNNSELALSRNYYASVHSSTSSTKSFSARQYERERENRLLAKARERERGDGGSTSPRSLENLIDGPLPTDTWPHLEAVTKATNKAFSPEVLGHPSDLPFPDIDQADGFENPFSLADCPRTSEELRRAAGHGPVVIVDPLARQRMEPLRDPLTQQPVLASKPRPMRMESVGEMRPRPAPFQELREQQRPFRDGERTAEGSQPQDPLYPT